MTNETNPQLIKKGQVHKLEKTKSGEELSLDAVLLDIYNKATAMDVSVGTPSIPKRFIPERVNRLINLFKTNINPSSAEYFLAAGTDVGMGLFTFADFQKDSNIGLYLTYRICAMPFIGYQSQLYLGVCKTPPYYDDIFLNGVPDAIGCNTYTDGNKEDFSLATRTKKFGFFNRKTSQIAKELFKELHKMTSVEKEDVRRE